MMESIDEAINYEEEYLKYLPSAKKNGNSLIAKCPFHDDSNPSFSVDLTSGKYHCFGCEEKGNFISFKAKLDNTDTQSVYQALCESYNIPMPEFSSANNENEKFCLESYAKSKMIPQVYLEKIWKLSDHKKGIKIPYYDEKGNLVATRYRGENKKFRWEKDSKIIPYGLERIKNNTYDYVILVEGESDTQSLALAGLPVLGIPGATMFRTEWLRYFYNKKVYIHNENDAGGMIFRNKVCESFYKRNSNTEIYEFTCSDAGCKDPSDLFKKCVGKYENVVNVNNYQTFRKEINQLIENAVKLDLEQVMILAQEPVPNMPARVRIQMTTS